MNTKKIEILAPAGGFDSVISAVRSGADAVYLGAKALNARRGATNFDADALKEKPLMKRLSIIINVILSVLGIVAVIVIILGGFTYITSNGDAAKVTKGKNIILYGVIGLVVALLAFAIVNFVLGSVFNS